MWPACGSLPTAAVDCVERTLCSVVENVRLLFAPSSHHSYLQLSLLVDATATDLISVLLTYFMCSTQPGG